MTNDQTTDHRPHRPVPESVRAIVDTAFHRHHADNSAAMRCAADVVAEVHLLDAAYLEQLAVRCGVHASDDYLAGLRFAAKAIRDQDAAPKALAA